MKTLLCCKSRIKVSKEILSISQIRISRSFLQIFIHENKGFCECRREVYFVVISVQNKTRSRMKCKEASLSYLRTVWTTTTKKPTYRKWKNKVLWWPCTCQLCVLARIPRCLGFSLTLHFSQGKGLHLLLVR